MIDFPKTIESLDEDYATPRTTLVYPHIRLLTPTDALALVVMSLPKGDLPLVMTYKGETREVGKVSHSALTLSKLLKITDAEFVRSANDKVPLKTGQDILELGVI